MKKSLYLALMLYSSTSLANQQINMQNYLDNNNAVDGRTKEFTSEYQDATKIDDNKGFYNYREVVYSRLLDYRLDNNKENKFSTATKVETFDVVAYQDGERLKAIKEEEAKKVEEKTAEEKINVVMQGN